MSDIERQAAPGRDTDLFVTEEELLELPKRLLKLINQTTAQERVGKDDLPERIGIAKGRVNAIMNPGSQGSKRLPLSEISKVVKFARHYALTLQDQQRGESIIGYCNEIAKRIQDRLEIGGLSLTETAFVTNLSLSDRVQQAFSDRHAGVYALIRLDRDQHILISRMDVHLRQAQLCRFATDFQGFGLSEPKVEGFIYSIGDEIQAVGRPSIASALRTSILRSRSQPGSLHGADMIGLRLGISDLDGGPFAYRIYCRQIAGPDQIGLEMPEWRDLFHGWRHEQAESVERMIPDVHDILKLLHEQDNKTPWGIGFPTGISEDGARPE